MRSNKKEIIDLGPSHYTSGEYRTCLEELGFIGEKFGGQHRTLSAFVAQKPFRTVLEVGCGGGHFISKLAKHFPGSKLLGIDLDPQAISYARKFERENLSFSIQETKELGFEKKSFDVVTATLVCHHMSDEELVSFLKQSTALAKKAVIINDLHRSWLASVAFWLLCRLFLRNRLIRKDGLTSIRRGFLRKEWKALLKQANIEHAKIHWVWPFRWVIKIQCQNM